MTKFNEKTENIITTYHERSLHATLKKHFCPDESHHEVKMGRFVADACDGKTIFEIQTGNFKPLSKKMQFYLENTDLDIVVVRPIAQKRRILWLNKETGELEKPPRFSSKSETLASGIADLYYLKEAFGQKRLTFCFMLMQMDEVRILDGYGKNRKIRATSVDRIAGEIFSIHYIKNVEDIKDALFPSLPDCDFSREELSKSLKLKALKLWSAQKLLTELNIISCKKVGNRLIFHKINKD